MTQPKIAASLVVGQVGLCAAVALLNGVMMTLYGSWAVSQLIDQAASAGATSFAVVMSFLLLAKLIPTALLGAVMLGGALNLWKGRDRLVVPTAVLAVFLPVFQSVLAIFTVSCVQALIWPVVVIAGIVVAVVTMDSLRKLRRIEKGAE